MPRFFFDLCTPDRFERDSMGLTFASLEDAYLSANQAAVDISIDLLRERKDPSRYKFEMRDEGGVLVMELPFSEVLQPRRATRPYDAAHIHDRLQDSIERSRKLRADVAAALAQARESALKGLALIDVDGAPAGTVE